MATIKKYNGSTWENAVVRKYGTASEIITPPTTIYADGTAITSYTLKGNTTQSGTPTPSNPVDVNGVGERTENIYDKYHTIEVRNLGIRYGQYVPQDVYSIYNDTDNDVIWGTDDMQSRFTACQAHSTATIDMTIYPSQQNFGFIMPYNDASLGDITIVQGSTPPTSYIPYGYKIPILTNQTTTNIYIGDNPLRKSLDGTAYDTLDSNGTLTQRVDSDGSVLATPIVSQITVPSIPTTEGANSIRVDTTVQPSEFTATWTGWHNATVKEWDGSDWQ